MNFGIKSVIAILTSFALALVLYTIMPFRTFVKQYMPTMKTDAVLVQPTDNTVVVSETNTAILESDVQSISKYKTELAGQILVGSYPYENERRYIYLKPKTNEFSEVFAENYIKGTYDVVCAEPRLRIHFVVYDNDGNAIHEYGSDAAPIQDSTRSSILYNSVCNPAPQESEKEVLESQYSAKIDGYSYIGTYPVEDESRRYMYTKDNQFVTLTAALIHVGSFNMNCSNKTVTISASSLNSTGSKEMDFTDTASYISDSTRVGLLFNKFCKN